MLFRKELGMVSDDDFDNDDEGIAKYSVASDDFWEDDEIIESEDDEREELIRLGIDPDWDFSKDWFWQEDPYDEDEEEDEEEDEGNLDDIELEFADESDESSLSSGTAESGSENLENDEDLLTLGPDEIPREIGDLSNIENDDSSWLGLFDGEEETEDTEEDYASWLGLFDEEETQDTEEDEFYDDEESKRSQPEVKLAEDTPQYPSSFEAGATLAQEVREVGGGSPSDKDSHDEVHYVTLRPSWVERVVLVAIAVVIAVGVSVGVGSLLFSAKTAKSTVGKSAAPNSPQAVATSILGGLEGGHLGSVCRYVAPPEQTSCQGGVGSGLFMGASNNTTFRNLKVKNVIVSGNQAIVLVSGEVCAKVGSSCSELGSVPVPKTYATFKKLYSSVVSGSGTDPVMAFVRTGNHWYLELG
jgi:hypothetical protein